MSALIYILIALAFFLIAAFVLFGRMFYLNKYPESYDSSYDGHEKFTDFSFKVIRFGVRKFFSVLKVFYQNLLHLWVRGIARINSFSEKIYMKSRNKFVDEVVKDRKAVPHFWSHLKKYKREIDEEKEDEKATADENLENK